MRNKQKKHPVGPSVKLPPLLNGPYQVDDYLDGNWLISAVQQGPLSAIKNVHKDCLGAVVVRNLRTGKIVYRNKAARAAGIGGSK